MPRTAGAPHALMYNLLAGAVETEAPWSTTALPHVKWTLLAGNLRAAAASAPRVLTSRWLMLQNLMPSAALLGSVHGGS